MTVRKRRRLSTSAAMYIPVSVLLIAFFTILGTSVFTKIIEIEVIGATIYSEEEIISASGITAGDNMININKGAVSLRIFSEKPFVKEVKITRHPPSTLVINVTESTAIAFIAYQDKMLIVDTECKILSITDSAPEGLVEIIGLSFTEPEEGSYIKPDKGSDIQLKCTKAVLEDIEKVGFVRDISYINVENNSKIRFEYVGKFKVVLGGPADARYKLSQLPGYVEVIMNAQPKNAQGEIDMSDPSGKWSYYPNK